MSSSIEEPSSYVRELETCETLTQYADSFNRFSVVTNDAMHDETSECCSESEMCSSDKLSEECRLCLSSLSNCIKNHNDKMRQNVACDWLAQFYNLAIEVSAWPQLVTSKYGEKHRTRMHTRTLKDGVHVSVNLT